MVERKKFWNQFYMYTFYVYNLSWIYFYLINLEFVKTFLSIFAFSQQTTLSVLSLALQYHKC